MPFQFSRLGVASQSEHAQPLLPVNTPHAEQPSESQAPHASSASLETNMGSDQLNRGRGSDESRTGVMGYLTMGLALTSAAMRAHPTVVGTGTGLVAGGLAGGAIGHYAFPRELSTTRRGGSTAAAPATAPGRAAAPSPLPDTAPAPGQSKPGVHGECPPGSVALSQCYEIPERLIPFHFGEGTIHVAASIQRPVHEAIRHLQANSPTFRDYFGQLLSHGQRLEIHPTDAEHDNSFDPDSHIVYWSPDTAIKFPATESNGAEVCRTASPAAALAHELGHAYEFFENPLGATARSGMPDPRYQDAVEYTNIQHINAVHAELGEGLRQNHLGQPIPAANVTDHHNGTCTLPKHDSERVLRSYYHWNTINLAKIFVGMNERRAEFFERLALGTFPTGSTARRVTQLFGQGDNMMMKFSEQLANGTTPDLMMGDFDAYLKEAVKTSNVFLNKK